MTKPLQTTVSLAITAVALLVVRELFRRSRASDANATNWVDVAGEDSFPASDPPSFNPGHD